jgi:hypothetical protein
VLGLALNVLTKGRYFPKIYHYTTVGVYNKWHFSLPVQMSAGPKLHDASTMFNENSLTGSKVTSGEKTHRHEDIIRISLFTE